MLAEVKQTVVLFVHGPRNVGGDSVVMLRTIECLDPSSMRAVAVVSPGGEPWRRFEKLASAGRARVYGVDMGVAETDPGSQPRNRLDQALASLRAFPRLIGIVRKERVDVVYTLDRSRSVLLAVLVGRLLRRGVLFHAHYPYYPSSRWSAAVVRAATVVIAISEFIRHEYEQRGISGSRIRTVLNGIDTRAVRDGGGDPATTRRRLGIALDDPLVLLPGRLSRYKGQLELVEAMPAVLGAFPNARFLFAGYDSPELGDLRVPGCSTVLQVLERRAAELGVSERAHFLGATGAMAELYAAADVVAVPSWAEPFGLVVAEAMAAGRAVVGTDAGAIPELVLSDHTGLLVPPRDPAALAGAISRLLGDAALRTRMGEAAQARANERFSIERYCAEIERALRESARK
jgi:glycosyltransferase involved in cell wall biosynthesis